MRTAVRLLVWLALAGPVAATLAGMLAPLSALLDLPNQFRPHLLVVLLMLCGITAAARLQRALFVGMAFLVLNFALAVPPFFFMAPPAASANGKTLKIVMANVWGRNRDFDPLVRMLRDEKADLVLLAEADTPIARTLAGLTDLYPYRADCIDSHFCRLALLSRFPLQARIGDRSNEVPPHIVATVEVDGQRVNVVGTHLARPYSSRWQTREIDFLLKEIEPLAGPLIMLGDFNATPWSWTMLDLQLRGGLDRHNTLGASWPAHTPLPPQLLLEHILSRGGIGRIDARVGPFIKSDHLPLLATVMLPTR